MASARNLCQHSDSDGRQCTSNDYILCPHCQLQLCLKHLNSHQDLLREELYLLCDGIDHVRTNLDNLVFDSNNRREYLFKQLDHWYDQELNFLKKIYDEKKQEIQILCLKSHMEFDVCKHKKEKQLKENLIKQLNRVLKQKQIHMDDLDEMKRKLDYIQRGLDELMQLNVDIHFKNANFEINIVKKRYIEAAKPLFNDDDNNLWDSNNEDDEEKVGAEKLNLSIDDPCFIHSTSPSIIFSSSLPTTPPSPSSALIVRKPPLKLVIKRLQHPTISTEIKYKLQTVTNSVPIIT